MYWRNDYNSNYEICLTKKKKAMNAFTGVFFFGMYYNDDIKKYVNLVIKKK